MRYSEDRVDGKIAPSLEMLILLSERFHKSVDWILRGEGH